MTSTKSIRNLIIALIILAIGVWFIGRISDSLIGKFGTAGFDSFILQFKQISTTIILALSILIVLLIVIYIAKKLGGRVPEVPKGVREIGTPIKPKF